MRLAFCFCSWHTLQKLRKNIEVFALEPVRPCDWVLGSNGAKCGAPHFVQLLPNTHVATGEQVGIREAKSREVAELKRDVAPEKVLERIEERSPQ